MTPAMESAFNAGSGFHSSYVFTAVVLIAAGIAYVWGANAVRMLFGHVMKRPADLPRGTQYVFRVVILLMVITYLFS